MNDTLNPRVAVPNLLEEIGLATTGIRDVHHHHVGTVRLTAIPMIGNALVALVPGLMISTRMMIAQDPLHHLDTISPRAVVSPTLLRVF